MHHLRSRKAAGKNKAGDPRAARLLEPIPGGAKHAPSGHLIIAIHGSPMSRKAAMKMTPKTAPRTQKSFAGR
jgi:hypothetical protein